MKNWLRIEAQNFPATQSVIVDYFKSEQLYCNIELVLHLCIKKSFKS